MNLICHLLDPAAYETDFSEFKVGSHGPASETPLQVIATQTKIA